MVIGIPREIMHDEGRVSATPETVKKMKADGFEVLVETKAGAGAFFADEEYAAAGAELVADVAELYRRADIVLKVKEPLFNQEKGLHEIDMMHEGQYLITFIHPASPVNHEMVRRMAAKGIIGLTLDGVPRISRAQNMDALTSMSTCAGYKGILIAANDLPKFMPQIFSAVGMIKPINTLVIGPAEKAMGQGGYALALDEETLAAEREKLAQVVKNMDIIFCSALVPSKLAPVLLTEEMVKSMKPGSVIVDISIDQGGNCALTVPGDSVVKYGVTIHGIKNIPGLLPTSSTWMFAQNIYNLVKYLNKSGSFTLDRNDEIVKGILTTVGGEIVHQGALDAMKRVH